MTAKYAQAVTELGPGNNSGWTPPLGALQAVAGSGAEQVLFVVPPASVNTVFGHPVTDGVAGYTLSQTLLTAISGHAAAEAGSTLTFNLRRAGIVVGGGGFAGWLAVNAPAITAFEPVAVAFLPANTALLPVGGNPVSATRAILPLQAGDVITVVSNIPADPFAYITLDGV